MIKDILNMIDPYPLKLIAAGILIMLSVYLLQKVINLFFDKTNFLDEKRGQTLRQLINDVLRYVGIITFIFYAITPIFDVSKVLAGAGVLTVIIGIACQSLVKDIIIGVLRLWEDQLHHGDFIKINGAYSGTIEEIGIRFMKIRQWDGILLTMSHGDIREIQNGNIEKRRVVEKLVLNYRQDPEEALKILEEVAMICNEKYSDCLLKDESGAFVEDFQAYGITQLNAEYHGIEYAITAVVYDDKFMDATKGLRYELAIAAYQNKLKMAEFNVFYRTRAETSR